MKFNDFRAFSHNIFIKITFYMTHIKECPKTRENEPYFYKPT